MNEKRKREDSVEEEQEPKRPIKPIPASKLQAFTIGKHKKSAFQKHKEEEELKKQAKAARVYAEFVASFEEPKAYKLGTTSFVKSGTLMPKDHIADEYKPITTTTIKPTFKPMPFVKAGETTTQPAPSNSTTMKNSTSTKTMNEAEYSDEEDDALAKLKNATKAQKKLNLDSFLEEIKKGQEVRTRFDPKANQTSSEATDDLIGSFDDGNPDTTNLYVGNINPTMTETGLCHEF
ncbi:U2 snRNP-associated SURP domain-containing protein, partial [Rhizopus stolonifer]